MSESPTTTAGWLATYPDGTPHIVIMRDSEELAWTILGANSLHRGMEMLVEGWTLRRVEVRNV